ncbi:TauD/TfdA family dioxygenase [Chitinophaga polysaccharea]|uniref:TauD/TfdA family dioxygenase n=1 Tax=Chitinophaga TaxID=79328 RepID=UPI0014553AE8|nr:MULTISPECIES: TauD/TfdA family dioxygenase [Chitinophaga]NLR57684.1 TauD/TfdA family dioxygenase [Chitinophaga polysaccharea]NLU93276.1 TauD/TfdA family dioxygenase [Chitinophaga sp. Ak27]
MLTDIVHGQLMFQPPAVIGQAPVIVTPSVSRITYAVLLDPKNRDYLQQCLLENGALLIRGFEGLDNVDAFHETFQALCGEMLKYQFQTSPRTEVDRNIYTSTDHPASQVIHMHTESSYSAAWPRHIGFFCSVPATEGGETPIANEMSIINEVGEDVITRFRNKGVKYVRNFVKGLGLSWQKAYQVSAPAEVEALLAREGATFSWFGDGYLRVEWTLPAFQSHPVTRNQVWFNHMYFGHLSLYDKKVRSVVPEEYLPFLTYYGDGSIIEKEVIDRFSAAYNQLSYVFRWQTGDLLLLENMLFSHGRSTYSGNRKILVGMANEISF